MAVIDVIVEIFKTIWRIVAGWWLFSTQWLVQEKRKKLHDPHFLINKKIERYKGKFAAEERAVRKRVCRGLTKTHLENRLLYNYVNTCHFELNPNKSLAENIRNFYKSFHPYIMQFYITHQLAKKYMKNGNTEKYFAKLRNHLESNLDIMEHAEKRMSDFMKGVVELRKTTRVELAGMQDKEKIVENRKLKEDKELLEESIKEMQTQLKNVTSAIHGPQKSRSEKRTEKKKSSDKNN